MCSSDLERCRRPAGLLAAATGVLAALLLAGVRGLGEHASPVAAAVAALAAGAALIAAMQTAKVDATSAVVLAFAAAPLAAAAGFAGLPGLPSAAHLLLATALAAAAASAGLAVLGTAAPVLLAVVLGCVLAALAALLAVFDLGSPGGLAAAASAVAVGVLPVLPRVSVRLAGLPPPMIPTTPDEMIAADEQWELASPEEVRYQSRLAHTYLGGLVLGASAVAGAGAVLAAGTGGWAGATFSSVVVSVLLLRSRGYVTAAASAAPLAAGLAAGSGLVLGLVLTGPNLARLGAALGLLGATGLALWLVWAGPKRETSPVLRRTVDVIEAVLVVATFPLALAVLNIYQVVRELG